MGKQVAKSSLYQFSKVDGGYAIKAPTLKGLVLSGGGSRGIAYPGMMRAMAEQGKLETITHIAGASAGAMTGSFIALGYNADEIEQLLTALNFTNLLDRSGYTRIRAKGKRFQHLLDLVYLIKIKEYLSEVSLTDADESVVKAYESIALKVSNYEDALESCQLEVNTLRDITDLSQHVDLLERIDAAFKPLMVRTKDEDGNIMPSLRFTFADFESLRLLLPEQQKHQIKHLTVVTTNQTQKILVVHNNDTSANESVAQCSQASGAHPVLFSPIQNINGDYIADGALQDNMPSHVLGDLGLSTHEILSVALTTEAEMEERLSIAKGSTPHTISNMAKWLDTWFHSLVGTKICDYFASCYNREKLFYHFGNMLYLNAG